MAVDAAAYTVGDNIVFGPGRFDPAGHAGRRLIAHELAHVVQQRASPGIQRPLATSLTIGSDQDPLERDADAQAQTVMQDASVSPRGARAPGAGVIQREPLEQTFSQDEAAVKPRCGPDITKWFVDRANEKMTDPGVLLVQSHLAIVEALAPMFFVTAGILASAGTTVVVFIKEAMLGERAPARDDNAKEQIGQGIWNLMLSVGAAALSAPLLLVSPPHRTAAIALASNLVAAAVKWGTLVTHESEYDFKKGVLSFPKTGFCPDPKCDAGDYGVVTICPDSSGLNCYDTDAPGNIFYSLVGKYAGWNELTIKLGSQLAELMDDKRAQIGWDTADDIKALALGHSWTLPLDAGSFCSGVRAAKSELAYQAECRDCVLPFDGKSSGVSLGTGGARVGGATKK